MPNAYSFFLFLFRLRVKLFYTIVYNFFTLAHFPDIFYCHNKITSYICNTEQQKTKQT